MDGFETVSVQESIPPLCVGTREAAQLLNLSEKTVLALVDEGKLRYLQPGGPSGKILFRVATLDRWLVDNETTTPPARHPDRPSRRRSTPEGSAE